MGRHWGVENSLHWCLDMTFNEDYSRTRKDHSAENFAVIRHIALNVLKRMDDKMSVARRRRHCSYDEEYFKKGHALNSCVSPEKKPYNSCPNPGHVNGRA